MEPDSPILCWTKQDELLVRIASYVEDTKTLSLISRCSRYCYQMLLPRRCRRLDVFIVDMASLLLFVERHIDATYQCRTLEVIGKADIANDPRSKAAHEALEKVLAHIGTHSSGLRNFSYTTPWNEPFLIPDGIWTSLALSRQLEELDTPVLLDRNPALLATTLHRLWKVRLTVGITDTLDLDAESDSVKAGEQTFLAFLRRHSGLEALLLIYHHPARVTNLYSLDFPDLDLFSLDLRGYDDRARMKIPPECLYQYTFIQNHPGIRSIALPFQ